MVTATRPCELRLCAACWALGNGKAPGTTTLLVQVQDELLCYSCVMCLRCPRECDGAVEAGCWPPSDAVSPTCELCACGPSARSPHTRVATQHTQHNTEECWHKSDLALLRRLG
jgi:hypothetical protein